MAENACDAGALLARGERTLVPLPLWNAHREPLVEAVWPGSGRIGVLLEPSDDPDALAGDLARIAMIAIRFPSFTDGRGYSSARRLREQHRWSGPLMAVGDVLRDQLLLLERCGFDSFWLRADQDVDAALTAFGDFSEHYQSVVDRAPLFARRTPAEALQ